jgi:hypothetical protein
MCRRAVPADFRRFSSIYGVVFSTTTRIYPPFSCRLSHGAVGGSNGPAPCGDIHIHGAAGPKDQGTHPGQVVAFLGLGPLALSNKAVRPLFQMQ